MKMIILKSSCGITLNTYITFLTRLLSKFNIKFNKHTVPTKHRKITLLRSPHVYKKAKEQFQVSTFTVIISLKENNISTVFPIYLYCLINKPHTIKIKIKSTKLM
jgi:ribosomal protein S10